ncbi:mediator of RNA polymerase II transcription subunit 1 [Physcia stellaris]|nr:mediator of RNA polymerase II transcription subunit 1 [Physcia stellaris]
MATPTSTPRPHAAPSRPTPRSTTAVHTPTPMSSVTSPPAPGSTPATLRSVASPAYLRSNFAKASPLSHTLGANSGGFSMSRVPTGASQTGSTGSNAALDAHVALMEKTGLTPAGMGMGMGTGMSPLGAGQAGTSGALNGLGIVGVRDQDEERRKKVEEIVALVGTRWGRVCQEGLERAAKRVGLECLWEEGRGGKRMLSIAGNGVLVDVEFNLEEVKNVTLEFSNSGAEVGKSSGDGADILKKDLAAKEEVGYVMLDAFVGNLERLARMDKLSEGGVDCFDAVEGIRAALQTVFDLEVGKARESKGPDARKEAIDREVLCRGSGRPKMHTRGRVGLALQYWMERHLLLPTTPEQGAMDIDTDTPSATEEEPTIHSLIIETEGSSSSLYPSIRIPDSWLGSPLEKPASTEDDPFLKHTSSLNWQEPPPTYLAPDKPPENTTTSTDLHTPNVRFIARFEPPLVVPLQVAADIHLALNAPLTQESIQPTTYESLLFADVPVPQTQTQAQSSQRAVTKKINSYDASGAAKEHTHRYTLFTLQPDYGRTLDSLPFSHPRQLIAILPQLRQWALVGSILRRSFAPDPDSPSFSTDKDDESQHLNGSDPDTLIHDSEMTVDEELAALLADDDEPPIPIANGAGARDKVLPIDITLSTTSSPPRISVVWPQGRELRSVDFGIGPGGVVEVLADEEGQGEVLGIAEEVGVLVEWLCRH